MTADPSPSQALRADAARNRERILIAAESLFLERGADASLDEVAKRAKVGIGTLYRRFPTREALLAAMSDERLLALAEASRARDQSMPPDQSIRQFMEELVIHTCHYRGLAASLGAVLQSGTPGCHASQQEATRQLKRAQDADVLRQDVLLDDLVCVVTAISLAVEQAGGSLSRVRHLTHLFIDGFSNPGRALQVSDQRPAKPSRRSP